MSDPPLFEPVGPYGDGAIGPWIADADRGQLIEVAVRFAGHGAAGGTEVEVATRRWPDGRPFAARVLEEVCNGRDFLERRIRGVGGPDTRAPKASPADARTATAMLTVDGVDHDFVVVETPYSWIAAVIVEFPYMVRVFAATRPVGLTGVRRVLDIDALVKPEAPPAAPV